MTKHLPTSKKTQKITKRHVSKTGRVYKRTYTKVTTS